MINFMFKTRKGHQILTIAFFSFVILSYVIFALFPILESAGYSCSIKDATGFSCFGCGGTRALKAALKFDFLEAFRYNPVYVILGMFFTGFMINFGIHAFFLDRPLKLPKFNYLWIIGLVVLVIGFIIIRNTPFYLQFFYV